MNTYFSKALPMFAAGVLMIWGCSDSLTNSEQQDVSGSVLSIENQGMQKSTVNKPFKARFFTMGGVEPGEISETICGDPPLFYNVQEGYGEGTHLGRFQMRITFCVDITDLLDDGVLSEGESLPYYSNELTEGYMVAANGDMLFIEIENGEVVPTSVPGYVFEFQDPFKFTGGTGRFKDVSGQGMTDSLVLFEPVERTDHYWSGVLSFPRGR